MMRDDVRIVWAPQPGPQHALVDCPFTEVLFGGARGGGKSDGVLGKFAIKAERYGSAFNAVFFRKEMPQADDLIERAKEIYCPLGADWREQPRSFRFPGGGRVRFRPLENVADAAKYQGQNLSDAAVEEAGNYEDPRPIDMLFGALRSKGGTPVQLILTANPGGVGQQWIKHRYIDPAPMGMRPLVRKLPNGAEHRYIYIPSRVQDNRILLHNDPTYINRLHLVGSPELVRAWLEGDWSVVSGAFFPEWSADKHIVAPRSLPAYWHRFRSFDWGSARPFSVGWWAVSDGELPEFPAGSMIRYREWYGAQRDESGRTIPNTGLRLTAEEVADGIVERERSDTYANRTMTGVADPSIFAADGGPSIADRMAARKVYFRAADNTRVGRSGAMGGWDQLRARLKGDGETPALFVFSTCTDFIRTVPALQHDVDRPEDIDSDGEDHIGDECFIAGTLIETESGPIPIERVHVGERVLTRSGYREVTAVFSNGVQDVFSVPLSDGTTLVATGNHPIWVDGRSFIPLNDLRAGDILLGCKSLLSAAQFRNSTEFAITFVDAISSVRAFASTVWSGVTSTVQSLMDGMSIIKTETVPITNSPTWNALLRQTMGASMGKNLAREESPISPSPLRQLLCGTHLRLEENGTLNTMKSIGTQSSDHACSANALSAASSFWRIKERTDFVQTPADPHGGAPSTRTTCAGRVRAARPNSRSTAMLSSGFARFLAQVLNHMFAWSRMRPATSAEMSSKQADTILNGVLSVAGKPQGAERAKVYNLSVDQAEEYFANGVLVHNCRYACMSRPYTAPLPPSATEGEPDRYARTWRAKRTRGSAMAA